MSAQRREGIHAGLLGLLCALAVGACTPDRIEGPGSGDSGTDTTDDVDSESGDGDSGDGDSGDGDGDSGDGDSGDGDSGDGDSGDGDSGDGDGDTGDELPPAAPMVQLQLAQVKQFRFTWAPSVGAEYYRLFEKPNQNAQYTQVGADTISTMMSITVPLHARAHASYVVQACNDFGCTDSNPVDVAGSLAEAIGYFKPSNTGSGFGFGFGLALSGDGLTLAAGAMDDSNAVGIGGNQDDESANRSGAVYVFVRDDQGVWAQQAYIKASNAEALDLFGRSVDLSDDGNTLVVGAAGEASSAIGPGGDQADNSAAESGAVYVFVRDDQNQWSQQEYLKASNTEADDQFGFAVTLSGDGATVAVSAVNESSSAVGIDGDGADNSAFQAGAAYVFVRDDQNDWSQQAYIKASNTDVDDLFGWQIALNADGSTLAVGSALEDSNAVGVNGNEADNSASAAGAVYIFVRDEQDAWSQQAYVKGSNTQAGDALGWSGVALSDDGDTLAMGATSEDSNALGVGGNQLNNGANSAGAAYVLIRDGQGVWSQQAYIKASNTDPGDDFGWQIALSGDARVLAVSAHNEDSNAVGINGNQANNAGISNGAVYVFVLELGQWSQQAYVKASNTGLSDLFGRLKLSEDGSTLAVGAATEDSNAVGIGGNQLDNSAVSAGAVYLY